MSDGPKISLSLGAKKPAHLPHHHHHRHSNGTKRPHSALHDSDDEGDDAGKHQEITHFDKTAGGGVHSERKVEEKKPLVIPVGENSRKRQKGPLPSQSTEAAEAAAAEAKVKAQPINFGLNVAKKSHEDVEVAVEADAKEDVVTESKPQPKTAEQEALEALLGKKSSSNAVIPTLVDEETFLRDYNHAPDAPTEADYDAVPIDEFGAAMLRGMGWKDGEAIGRNKGQAPVKSRTLERRPELLGVGAKPAKALGIELGEWGKHAKKHERKIDQAYSPLMLKNKKTGEMITEEQLQAQLKEQEMGYVDNEDSGSRKDSDRKRDKEREPREKDYKSSRRERSRSRDDRKHRSSRRERGSSREDHRRRRDDDDNSDRERRERRRDRERRTNDRSVSRDRYKSHRRDDIGKDERRYRDDDRSSRKERSHRERSERDK